MGLQADYDDMVSVLTQHLKYALDVDKFVLRTFLRKKVPRWVGDGLEPPTNEPSEAGAEAAPQQEERRTPLAIEDGPLPAVNTDDAASSLSSRSIDRRIKNLMSLPVIDLKLICTRLEPISLGPFQLAPHIKRGARQDSQMFLCEIIEAATGVDRNCDLDHQAFASVDELIDYLCELNEQRGRRCRDLLLPPRWALHGQFEKMLLSGRVLLHHRFDYECFYELPEAWGSLAFDELHIANNYSDTNATVSGRGHSERIASLLRADLSQEDEASLDARFDDPGKIEAARVSRRPRPKSGGDASPKSKRQIVTTPASVSPQGKRQSSSGVAKASAGLGKAGQIKRSASTSSVALDRGSPLRSSEQALWLSELPSIRLALCVLTNLSMATVATDGRRTYFRRH